MAYYQRRRINQSILVTENNPDWKQNGMEYKTPGRSKQFVFNMPRELKEIISKRPCSKNVVFKSLIVFALNRPIPNVYDEYSQNYLKKFTARIPSHIYQRILEHRKENESMRLVISRLLNKTTTQLYLKENQ